MGENFKRWSEDRALILGLLLVGLLSACFAFYRGGIYTSDSKAYLLAAENIALHHELYAGDYQAALDPDLYTLRPPAYPCFLGITGSSLGKASFVTLFFQLLLFALSVLLLLYAYEVLFNVHVKQSWLFVLLLLSPFMWIYPALIMSETLFLFFISLAFYLGVIHWKKPEYVSGLLLVLVISLAALTKPVAYPLALIVSLGLGVFYLMRKRYGLLWLLLIPILATSFYRYRNHERTGLSDYSSIQTINLCYYNVRYLQNQLEGVEKAAFNYDKLNQEIQHLPYPEKMGRVKQFALNYLSQHPWEYAWFHLKGMARFLVDPGRFDWITWLGIEYHSESGLLQKLSDKSASAFSGMAPALLLALCLQVLINVLKLILAIWCVLKRPSHEFLYWFFPLLAICFLTGPLGASRFMMPVALFILIPAAQRLGELADSSIKR